MFDASDKDDGAQLSYRIVTGVGPDSGTLVNNDDGTFSFDPAGDFEDLAAGTFEDVSFTYQVTDEHGAPSGIQTATIKVAGENDAPVAADVSYLGLEGVLEDGPGNTFAFDASDVDQGAVLTYTIVGNTPATVTISDPTSGTFSLDPTGAFESLAAGETASVTFDYQVSDGDLTSEVRTATVEVTGENDPPTADALGVTMDEDTQSVIELGALVDDVDGDPLAINLASLPVDGQLYQYAGQDPETGEALRGQPILSIATQVLDAEGRVILVSDANVNSSNGGNFSFDYQVIDPAHVGGLTATNTVSVSVTAVNDDPVISGPADLTVDEDTSSQQMSFTISDLDVNDPGGDGLMSVTVSAGNGTVSLPGTSVQSGPSVELTGLTLAEINQALQNVVYQGDADYHGADALTVTVNDGGNVGATDRGDDSDGTTTFEVPITVTAVNDPVTVTDGADDTMAEDSGSVILTGLSISDVDAVLDADGQYNVTLSVDNGTLSATSITGTLAEVNAALQTVSYTPDADFHGTAAVSVTVTDEVGGVIASGAGAATGNTTTLDITVTAENDPVTVTDGADDTMAEDSGSVLLTGLSISDVDAVLDPSGQYNVTLSVDNGTLSATSITGTLARGQCGASERELHAGCELPWHGDGVGHGDRRGRRRDRQRLGRGDRQHHDAGHHGDRGERPGNGHRWRRRHDGRGQWLGAPDRPLDLGRGCGSRSFGPVQCDPER